MESNRNNPNKNKQNPQGDNPKKGMGPALIIALALVLLFLIVGRCIQVGMRSQDMLRRLVCFGVASSLIFQIFVNVGMCVGVMPVIGLTLPFISYGGSSIVSLYAMLGLVSGVCARPSAATHERYIRPYR